MENNSRIGVFDSGLGGLSVVNAIRACMPNESIIYIGDSLHAPYGTKSKEEVYELSKAICDRFINSGVKAIVIACNTATSAAADRLRELYKVPIIGMEPAVKPALSQVQGRVFVFATDMTLKEEKFNALVEKYDEDHRVIKCPAPEWVDVVENDLEDDERVHEALVSVLSQYDISDKDGIVLGCTHFIFLKEKIEAYYHDKVEVFDGNMGTALQLKNILSSSIGLEASTHKAEIDVINTKSDALMQVSKQLLGL